MNLETGFALIALMDGTTINGVLRVEGTPLVQRYNKGTTQYIPDFETLAENAKPTTVLILRDISDGRLLIPSSLVWAYNGVALTFDDNGLSTNSGMVGVFKKVDNYSTTVGGVAVTLQALRVMKNVVPLSGYDNDKISVSGSVEVAGTQIAFNSLEKDVIIQETTGNQYDVLISNAQGSQILTAADVVAQKARVYKDGIEVTDVTGYSFAWHKILGAGDVAWGTSQIQNVTAYDVNNKLKMRCDVSYGGSIVASGYDEVTDFTDPIKGDVKITGISGTCVRPGETALLTPYAFKQSTGEEVVVPGNWLWNIKDNAGNPFILTGKDSATFSATSASVSYADMKRAKLGMSGSIGYSN